MLYSSFLAQFLPTGANNEFNYTTNKGLPYAQFHTTLYPTLQSYV